MPTNSDVEPCPRCGAPRATNRVKCASCGALVVAPPVPVTVLAPAAANASAADAAVPAAPAAEQFFAPTALLNPVVVREPVLSPAPVAPRRPRATTMLAVVIVVLLLGGGAYALTSSGHSAAKVPVVLPPHGANTGLPGSLQDVVRIQAESSRQIAFSAISEAYSETGGQGITPQMLQNVGPALTWVDGSTSSTGPHEVSYIATSDGATIAISASSREVCAYGKWAPGQVSQYVTMANVSSCRANEAPAIGWSTLAGGANTDLPPDGP